MIYYNNIYNMSLLKFSHNGHNWGIVRNQKCASTSVLSYIAQVLWDANPNDLQAYNTFKVNAPGVYRKLLNFSEYELDLMGCNVRVAVWRDPVEKFVSGFYHTMFSPTGAQDALWQGPHTLDEFLENFNYYYNESIQVREHCSTNTARLGPSPHVYTDVYYYTETHKLASMLGAKTIVNHRQTDPKPELTDKQRERIVELQYQDYVNGWA